MAELKKGEVSFDVDGTSYVAVLDVNAMTAIEELFSTPERDVLYQEAAEKAQRGSMRHLRALFWGVLRTHQPELTLEQAGALLSFRNLPIINEQLMEVMKQAVPDPKDLERLGVNGQRARPRKGQVGPVGIGTGSNGKRAVSA